MLLKLDHITYSISKSEYQIVCKKLVDNGYSVTFDEKKVPNPKNKKNFMKEYQEYVDMIYFEKKGFIAIEVVIYDKIHTEMDILEGVFQKKTCDFLVNDIDSMTEILLSLGGKISSDDTIKIKNLFDKSIYKIKLCKSIKKRKWCCDYKGVGCLTLLVSSCEKTRNKLLENNFICTEINEIKISQKRLNIFFVSNKVGDFVEVISIANNKEKEYV